MFTGIIQTTGSIVKIKKVNRGQSITVTVDPKIARGVPEGGSLAVDGVCLTRQSSRHPEPREGSHTVHDRHGILRSPRGSRRMTEHFLFFKLMDSTLKRTTLGAMKIGDRVNIEPAMRASDAVGGHFVSGHVDGVGVIKNVSSACASDTRRKCPSAACPFCASFAGVKCKMKNGTLLTVRVPNRLARYIVPQGSIAINGVSLTVVEVGSDWFSVALTAYTLAHTNIGALKIDDSVNIETDLFAKYIINFLNRYGSTQKISHRRGKI